MGRLAGEDDRFLAAGDGVAADVDGLALGGERDWDFDWVAFQAGVLTKEDCQTGGWAAAGFDNQGQCIQFVNTGQDSRGD